MKKIILAALFVASPFAQAQINEQWEPSFLEAVRAEVQVGPESALPAVISETFSRVGARDRWMITFEDAHLGQFRMLIEGPQDFRGSDQKHSVLLITAGYFAGTKPIDLLPQTGNQIVAAFEYTPTPELLILQPNELLKVLKFVPGRMYLSAKWLRQQAWVDVNQFHLFAVSLGALYMPVTERLMQADGMFTASSIYAFGGGSVKGTLREMFRQRLGHRESELMAEALTAAVMPYDPSIYLSKLVGPKLVIHANNDEVFPRDSQKILSEKLVGPKMICVINGSHIDIGRTKEIELTLGIVEPWVYSINQGQGFPTIEAADTQCATSM